MKSSLLAVLMLGACSCVAAAQQTIDGNKLQEQCRAVNKAPEQMTASEQLKLMYCFGFIRGTLDAVTLTLGYDKNHSLADFETCIPEEVSTGQQAKVLLKYLDAHPEDLHMFGSSLVLLAMRNAFPCKQ